MRQRSQGLALLLALSLAGAACGRLAQAVSSSPIPGPTLSPTPTPPSVPAPVCSGSSLQVLAEPLPGLSFAALWVMGLKNVGASACTVEGFPTISVHDAAGAPIAMQVSDFASDDALGSGNPSEVITLGPGQVAGFWLEDHVGPSPPPCPAVPSNAILDITPAGAASPASIHSFPRGFTCDWVAVSPFHPGFAFPPNSIGTPSPAITSSP